jgi:hypothetical protein
VSRHTKKHRFQVILALDSNYMPMVEMSRRKAIKALSTGRAHALDLRTWMTMSIADVASMPFHAVVFPKAKACSEVKLGFGRGTSSILKRDGHKCQYVGCDRKGTTVDHVLPRCQGGQSTWANLVACCPQCNLKKGGRTPDQAGMVLKGPVRSQRAILLDKLHALAGATQ